MKKITKKIQHPFMIKVLNKSDIKGTYLKILKGVCEKKLTSNILNGKKLKAFSLKSGTKQECPLSSLFYLI
jgi:hypothetical protein